MAVFELQDPATGKTYEVEAPDVDTAVGAFNQFSSSQGVGRFASPSMLAAQPPQMSTLDTVADVAKSAGVGVAQGAIGLATLPGNVEQLGRMGINAVGNFAGAEEPVVGENSFLPNYGDAKGAIERNITGEFYKPRTTAGEYARTGGEFASLAIGGPAGWANRAARVAVPAAASETAGQLTEGTALEPWARVAGALGGGMAAGAAQRAVSPMPTDPARQAAVRTLEQEGVTALTAGQKTGRPSLRWAESMSKDIAGGGGKALRMESRQAEQFTRAALRRAGVNADRATPDVMDTAFSDLGNRFNQLTARNELVPNKYFMGRLQKIGDDYKAVTAEPMRVPLVEKTIDALRGAGIRGQNGRIPGRVYQNYRSALSQQANAMRRSDPAASNAIRDVIDVIDRTMEASIRFYRGNHKTDAGAFKQTRNQYRNLLAIEDAVAGAGEGAAAGLISPSMLRNAAKKQGKRAYVRGKGDFGPLARAGEQVMKPLPQSGTAPRMNASSVLGAVGGVVTGSPYPAVAGLFGPALGSRVLMSRPVQSYLSNQSMAGPALLSQQAPAASRGLLALPGAMDAGLLGDY